MFPSLLFWAIFNAGIIVFLIIDLFLIHPNGKEATFRKSLLWTCVWIGLSLLFSGYIYLFYGLEPTLEFLTGYLIEKSLSIDNIFVFALLFDMFKTPSSLQHRVLFCGVIGAILMRTVLIFLGTFLIVKFHWILYLFGLFLVIIGIRMMGQRYDGFNLRKNFFLTFIRKHFPITPSYEKHHFFIRKKKKLFATPLFLLLLVIEGMDLAFAIDSIPAIFAVTQDPMIVYTSNIFAILGLRSLYFVLGGFLQKIYYLRHALSLILLFVGIKLLISYFIEIPTLFSLGIILGILGGGIFASHVRTKRLSSQ